MKQILAAACAALIGIALVSPAGASLTSSAASAISITNYLPHKSKHTKAEMVESARRQDSYKSYFSKKYGYEPTTDQIRNWYERAYGVEPV